MTIGEKIKYLRTRLGITQGKLAEFCEIHPVSIRKYETNKMIPGQTQIERLSAILGVSTFALSDHPTEIKLNTVGDFYGILILFHKSNILNISGERGEDGGLIPETVSFKVNPVFSTFFKMSTNDTPLNIDEIFINLKDNLIFSDIINWEKVSYNYEKSAAKYSDTDDKNIINFLNEMKSNQELIELELQRMQRILF